MARKKKKNLEPNDHFIPLSNYSDVSSEHTFFIYHVAKILTLCFYFNINNFNFSHKFTCEVN